MAQVTFRFVRPNSLIGRLICWRLKEPWSHVSILFDNCAYSCQVPRVTKLPLGHKDIAIPPRSGRDINLLMSTAEQEAMEAWCESQVGKTYDYMSILGWILGWSWLQSRHNTYCFEFVHQALENMDWLKPSSRLIKGNRLIEDLEVLVKRFVDTTAAPDSPDLN